MVETGGHHDFKKNKPGTERQLQHDLTYYVEPNNVEFLEGDSTMVVTSGYQWGKG